jgi:hypothetical protein
MLILLVAFSATPAAAPQAPPKELPVSIDRIRKELAKPAPKLERQVKIDVPVATFKTKVEQPFMPLFDEWLDKELELTEFQRQSADWASKCCAIGLAPMFNSVERALERRKVRKIRERIAGELAEIEAARKRAGVPAAPPKEAR